MDKNELRNGEFPSNSKTTRVVPVRSAEEKTPEKKKVQAVVTSGVKRQKRSFSKKVAETFLEDDTKNVGSYLLHDILIPAAKALISDMVGGGVEMLLFGERRNRNTNIRRDGGRSYTSYGSMYRSDDRDRDRRGSRDRDRRDISRTSRARHDFDDIIFGARGEAEDVLSHLLDLTIDYNQATVADLYDLAGITSDFTDNKYGWTDLRDARVDRVRGGYMINLPKPVVLD